MGCEKRDRQKTFNFQSERKKQIFYPVLEIPKAITIEYCREEITECCLKKIARFIATKIIIVNTSSSLKYYKNAVKMQDK